MFKKVVEPVLVNDPTKELLFVNFSFVERSLGGSAFAQSINKLGTGTPTVGKPDAFVNAFNTIQKTH